MNNFHNKNLEKGAGGAFFDVLCKIAYAILLLASFSTCLRALSPSAPQYSSPLLFNELHFKFLVNALDGYSVALDYFFAAHCADLAVYADYSVLNS